MNEKVTGKEMCELISEYLLTKSINMSWEEVWNFSPTGELFHVFELYQIAKEWKESK